MTSNHIVAPEVYDLVIIKLTWSRVTNEVSYDIRLHWWHLCPLDTADRLMMDNPDLNLCFQYICTSQSTWSSVNESVTSAWVCDYSPYQEVQCDVKAFNGAGDSSTASSPIFRTDCAGKCNIYPIIYPLRQDLWLHCPYWWVVLISAPTAPRNLQVKAPLRVITSNTYGWSYTASWKVE